jgi:hypothetical protein
LAALWRSRRWRLLLNILEHLPRTSAYAQALATDEELAERFAELPDTQPRATWSRSHREYTPEVEMLSAVFDRLGEVIRAIAASRGALGKPAPPAPRPVSAFERVRHRLARRKHERFAARVVRDSSAG